MKKLLQLNLSPSKKIALALFYLCFLFANFSRAQSLSGTVKKTSGNAIPSALIYVNGIDLAGTLYTNSDGNGKFYIKLPQSGKYKLTIKCIGYALHRDTLKINSDINLGVISLAALEDTSKTLQQVNVSGQKVVTKHLSDREVIDVENTYLGKLPAITDLLNQIPEITMDGTSISVLGKNNTAIFVNGHQSNLVLQSIPVQNISRIEVITNPSAKYDGNMEAIINVILKRGLANGFQGNVFGKYEQTHGNRYSYGGTLSYNSGIFNSSLDVGYYESTSNNVTTRSTSEFENYSPNYALNSNVNEDAYSYSLEVNLEMALLFNKNNKLSINGTWQPNYTPHDIFNESDNFTNNVNAKVDSSANSRVLWVYHNRYANGGISYINTNKLVTLETRFDVFWEDDATKTYSNFLFNNFTATADNVPIAINTDQYRKNLAYVPSLNFSHPFKNSKLEFGAKYYYITSNFYLNFSQFNFYTPDQNNLLSSTENIYEEYINYEGNLGKLSYEFGLRNEYSTLTGLFNNTPITNNLSKLLPSANLTLPTSENSKLIFSYSEKLSRVPFLRESPYYYFNGPFTASEGNPLLKPQTLQSLQLKYVYKSYYASLYFNDYTDFLGKLPVIDGNTTISQYSNYKRINYGLVLGSPVMFTSWWTSDNNLKVYHQANSGLIDSSKFSDANWTSSINIAENFKVKNACRLAVLFNYTLPYFDGANRVKSGPDFNLNLTKSVYHKRIDLSLYAHDIFNTYSYSYLYRNTSGVLYNAALRKDTRGIGVSIQYNFEKGRSTEKAAEDDDDIQSRL
jgi:hypothetical protein